MAERGRKTTGFVVAIAILVISVVALVLYFRATPRLATKAPTLVTAGRELPPVEESSEKADLNVSPDQLARIGIKYGELSERTARASIRTIGTVQPNAYKETKVTPIVGGRVVDVRASLGDSVRRGQVLATIFSPELSQEQMEYVKVEANLNLHVTQAERYRKLLEVGAVSLQEKQEIDAQLEVHHAEHASHRQKLKLMGLADNQIDKLKSSTEVKAEVNILSPADGVITQRSVNTGQNITVTDILFSVTDLSQVWVIASVYEKDLGQLRTGGKVDVALPVEPRRTFTGRIAYIDPKLDPATRTAQVRIELPNPGMVFRMGMFLDVMVQTLESHPVLVVPKAAVQILGNDSVAFVSTGNGRFRVARLQLGEDLGSEIQLVSGLSVGEKIVTEGSFYLKAEMARTAH